MSAPAAAPRPLIRIRTLLLLAMLAGGGWYLHPRAISAWKLQTSASTVADYALCMVGPTGPGLLRDNPLQFLSLVRRRLVSSAPNDRPFQACAKGAREITGSVEIERAHLATAWSFVEYGGLAADRAKAGRRGELDLGALSVSARPLAELSKNSWPFVRGGYVRLMKPSIRASEAIHPVELARPKLGRGLPSFRAHYRAVSETDKGYVLAVGRAAHLTVLESSDGGLNWRQGSTRHPRLGEFAERCPAGAPGRAFTLSLSGDARSTRVTSLGPDAAPYTTELTRSDRQVFATACDSTALVAAFRPESSREVTLALCPYRGRCSAIPLPRFAGVGAVPRFPLDVARVEGTTVLSVTMHGVVRVSSSRDDGRTWTPYTVAFDETAHPSLGGDVRVPGRLLALGKRVLLYGGAPKPSQTYPVLVSDDFGASFRSP